jgi:hypothetical protein
MPWGPLLVGSFLILRLAVNGRIIVTADNRLYAFTTQ